MKDTGIIAAVADLIATCAFRAPSGSELCALPRSMRLAGDRFVVDVDAPFEWTLDDVAELAADRAFARALWPAMAANPSLVARWLDDIDAAFECVAVMEPGGTDGATPESARMSVAMIVAASKLLPGLVLHVQAGARRGVKEFRPAMMALGPHVTNIRSTARSFVVAYPKLDPAAAAALLRALAENVPAPPSALAMLPAVDEPVRR